jgi:hypothetical protein
MDRGLVYLYHSTGMRTVIATPNRPAHRPDRAAGTRGLRRRDVRDSFASEGVVAWLDECHRERFNFEQEIWLEPTITMGSRSRRESEVLALNILTRLIPARNTRALVGVTSAQALRLAPLFVEDCLAARDPDLARWTIPIEALRAWLASHRGSTRASSSL